MPLDPSIPLSVRPPRVPSWAEAQQRAMSLAEIAQQARQRGLQEQVPLGEIAGQTREREDEERRRTEERAIEEALRRNTDRDTGTVDKQGVVRDLQKTAPRVAYKFAQELAEDTRPATTSPRSWQFEKTAAGIMRVDPTTGALVSTGERPYESSRDSRASREAKSLDLTPSQRRRYDARDARLRASTAATLKAGRRPAKAPGFLGFGAKAGVPWTATEADSIRAAEERALQEYEQQLLGETAPRVPASSPSAQTRKTDTELRVLWKTHARYRALPFEDFTRRMRAKGY